MSVRPFSELARHLALTVGAVLMLSPFVWMVLTAFKPESQILVGPVVPREPTLENFRFVLETVPLWRYYLNGLVVVAVIFVGQLLVCVPAAYALARLRFRGSALGLWTVLGCIMVPAQATALPVYVLLAEVGLLDTRAGLIVPFVGSAFGVFLLRQFFLTIPQSVFDAARLDGAGTFATLVNVVVPMARPAILSFGMFSVVAHWNDFFWPFFTLRTDRAATVPYAIAAFVNVEAGNRYGAQMAAAVLAVLPLVIGFLLAQRQFIHGVALAGAPE
jgi:multiple sugar transport system permease protein